MQAGLPDLTVLRDEAPNTQVKTQFGLIGVNSYLEGTRSLAFAATVVNEIKLPSDYTAASATAPHCKE